MNADLQFLTFKHNDEGRSLNHKYDNRETYNKLLT